MYDECIPVSYGVRSPTEDTVANVAMQRYKVYYGDYAYEMVWAFSANFAAQSVERHTNAIIRACIEC